MDRLCGAEDMTVEKRARRTPPNQDKASAEKDKTAVEKERDEIKELSPSVATATWEGNERRVPSIAFRPGFADMVRD